MVSKSGHVPPPDEAVDVGYRPQATGKALVAEMPRTQQKKAVPGPESSQQDSSLLTEPI